MLRFKSGQSIQPSYDGYTLADARVVAGDGLSVISIKQCHRHCHFTHDPESNEPLISCAQGLQARNTFFNLHKPDLRKVRGLECSTTRSVTDLLRSHNPDNMGKPTVKRRLFKILESLVTNTKSTKLPERKLVDRDPSLWPANICVLSTCLTDTDKKTSKNERQEFNPEDPSCSSLTTIHNFSKRSYDPLNEIYTGEMFPGPSTSSGIESYPGFLKETNEYNTMNKSFSQYQHLSNLNLERKTSLNQISLATDADESMYEESEEKEQDKYLKFEEPTTLKLQHIQEWEYNGNTLTSQFTQKTDLFHPKECESLESTFKSLSEDLDDIISYITRTNEVVDIVELENIPTTSQCTQYNDKYINDEYLFPTDQLIKVHHLNTNVLPLNLEEEQISFSNKDEICQRSAGVTSKNNSSIITINNNDGKRKSKKSFEDLSFNNYYEESVTSKYSYWEDDDLRMDLSTKELFVSNIQSDINLESENSTAIVPQQYFKEFWQECGLPYTGYLENYHTQNDSLIANQLHGYFHWESEKDENILEEAEHIMYAINEFLDTNIGWTSQRNEPIAIAELNNWDQGSEFTNPNTYVTLTDLDQLESWENSNKSEKWANSHGISQKSEEHTSNQSLYESSYEETSNAWYGRGRYNQPNYELPEIDMNPDNNDNYRFPYSNNGNDTNITKREILQKTHEMSQEVEELKNCIQHELGFSNLNQPLGKTNGKHLKAIYHHKSRSKDNMSMQIGNKYVSPVHSNILTNEDILTQASKGLKLREHQVTRSDNYQEQDIRSNQPSADDSSSIRLTQCPNEKKDCKDEISTQFLFSSPQMPINLTNPLNNTTYK